MIPLQAFFPAPPWVTQPVIHTFPPGLRASPTRDSPPTRTNRIYSPISSLLSPANPIFSTTLAPARTHKISAFSSCTPVPVRIPLNWTLIFCNDITTAPPSPPTTLRIPSRPSAPHRTHYPPTPLTRPDFTISLLATSQHSISSMHPSMGSKPSGGVLG